MAPANFVEAEFEAGWHARRFPLLGGALQSASIHPERHDWTKRYSLIVESALRNKSGRFVIDGEAVLLGVDGVSDFDGLHSRQHDDEVQLYALRYPDARR